MDLSGAYQAMKTKAKDFRIPFVETKYGFDWGAMKLERTASFIEDGSVVLTIKTPRETLQVRVTKTGFIRTEKKK